MYRIVGANIEKNNSFNRITGIYRDFKDVFLNIPFKLTEIGGIYEVLLESNLSAEKEDEIAFNILRDAEIMI